MEITTFEYVGYSDYIKNVSKIRSYLSFLNDDGFDYDMAINEAVCNAAQNSIIGVEKVNIRIDIRITNYDVVTKVSAKTKPFDMMSYRDRLWDIARRPAYIDWTDYTADTEASRGMWYMLSGTEYLYIDHQAQSVRLCARIPFNKEHTTKKMEDLLLRFFIEKDGVLL